MLHVALLLLLGTASAAPTTINQQGRVVDASGIGITGTQQGLFRLYPSQTANVGAYVWTETLSLQLVDGYYATVLGNDTPFDSALLESNLELWIDIDIGGTSLGRQPLNSVPYAVSAEGARTLTRSDCSAGEVLQFDGSAWVCAQVSGGGGGAVQSFYNNTNGWPGCASVDQKWTRMGDVVIYSVDCNADTIDQSNQGGSISASHSAIGTPPWAIPTTDMHASFIGATDASPLAGASGGADGPLTRAQALMVRPTEYLIHGYGSFGGQHWRTWASDFTAVYHITMQSSQQLGTLSNPAQSCNSIRVDQPAAADGTYWLDPQQNGNGYEAFCLMSYGDGGWTLISQGHPQLGTTNSLCTPNAVGSLSLNASDAAGGSAKLSNTDINAIWSDATSKELLVFGDAENLTGTSVTWDHQCSLDFVSGYQFHTGTASSLSQLESRSVSCETGSMPDITSTYGAPHCGYAFHTTGPQNLIYTGQNTYGGYGYSCNDTRSGRSWPGSGSNGGCNTSKVFVR
jgi:hypothetical protein